MRKEWSPTIKLGQVSKLMLPCPIVYELSPIMSNWLFVYGQQIFPQHLEFQSINDRLQWFRLHFSMCTPLKG